MGRLGGTGVDDVVSGMDGTGGGGKVRRGGEITSLLGRGAGTGVEDEDSYIVVARGAGLGAVWLMVY